MRYLGIDYGGKRIGLALSDENGGLAFPLQMVENGKRTIGEIKHLCNEKNVSTIVVGESMDFKGQGNPIMEEIKIFVSALEKETLLPVHLEPEFLTSAQASRIQGEHKKIDTSAATLILQAYLDKKRNGDNR